MKAAETGRDFSLIDAMVLIGAIAVGLAAHKPMPSALNWNFWPKAVVLPCASAWTVALLILHLRTPRMSRSLRSRMPGWIACLAGVGGIGIGLLDRITRLLLVFGKQGFDSARFLAHYRFPGWDVVLRDHLFSMDFIQAHYVGVAIAGAWITLAARRRRWPTVHGWLEFLSRATGVFWLVSVPLLWILQDYAENL